jgi:hypothetical protein
MPTVTPDFYTDEEGSVWLKWPNGRVPLADLEKRNPHFVMVGGFKVHSLRFPNGAEWDCVNGWR